MPMRLLAVADVYEALTSERPYRRAMRSDEALAIIRADVPGAPRPRGVRRARAAARRRARRRGALRLRAAYRRRSPRLHPDVPQAANFPAPREVFRACTESIILARRAGRSARGRHRRPTRGARGCSRWATRACSACSRASRRAPPYPTPSWPPRRRRSIPRASSSSHRSRRTSRSTRPRAMTRSPTPRSSRRTRQLLALDRVRPDRRA